MDLILNKPNPWLRVFLPFTAGFYLSYLLRNVNAVIAPDLTRDFGLAATDLGLLTSAYLIAFGAFQLPLGILLDRYGARRVETLLLLSAACGCAVFAAAQDLAHLVMARAMIGLGVSACLMASFKACSQWFPIERQASLNAAIMTAAALGALTATVPLGWALPLIGWRGSFVALALFALAASALIYSTPEKPAAASKESFATQLRGLAQVLKSATFWRFAPQTGLIVGGTMAVQGLWAVPWLMNFNNYTREVAATHLLLMSLGMLFGYILVATMVNRLAARGVSAETLLTLAMGVVLLLGLLMIFEAASTYWLWSAMGLAFSVTNLSYAMLSKNFPMQFAGRANTALNLFAFVGAFSVQGGFGAIVDLNLARGAVAHDAYRSAFAALLVAQGLSFAWYLFGARRPVHPGYEGISPSSISDRPGNGR